MTFKKLFRILTISLLSILAISLVAVLSNSFYRQKQSLVEDLLLEKNNAIYFAIVRQQWSSALVQSLNQELSTPDWSTSAILNYDGSLLFLQNRNGIEPMKEFLQSNDLKNLLNGQKSTIGIFENNGLIVSFRALVAEKKIIVSMAPSSTVSKSVLFQVLIASAIVLLMIGLAFLFIDEFIGRIGLDLESVVFLFQKLGQGNFSIRADQKSKITELEKLHTHFNLLAERMNFLIQEKEKKAYIQADLESARRIQENLLPPLKKDTLNYQIRSFFKSATSCGGDWLYYYENGSELIMMIGDVTGHGLSSALLTSACRASFSLFETDPKQDVALFLTQLNQIIYKTTNQRLQMTFLIFKIDLKTGYVSYCNASHEAPLFFNSSDQGCDYLTDRHGPRLGEKENTVYTQSHFQMTEGSKLFLFTDGIMEVPQKNGKNWTDRRLQSSLLKLFPKKDLHQIYNDFNSLFKELDHELKDDLSWILFHYSNKS